MCSPSWMRKPVRPPSILVCGYGWIYGCARLRPVVRFRGKERMRGTVANGQLTAGQERTVSVVMLGDRPPLKHLLKQTWPTELSLTYVYDISKTFSFWPPTNLSVCGKLKQLQIQAQTFGVVLLTVLWAGALPDEQPQRTRLLGTWQHQKC